MNTHKTWYPTDCYETNEAVVSLSIYAALADGKLEPSERRIVRQLLRPLAPEQVVRIYHNVFFGKTTMEAELDRLKAPSAKAKMRALVKQITMADGEIVPLDKNFIRKFSEAAEGKTQSMSA